MRRDLLLGVEGTCGVDETSAEDGVIPVKDYHCLVEFGFVLGS